MEYKGKIERNSVQFRVHGRYALFSDPITRPGGEKFSYQTPTYQAMKGVLESVYWKPTLIWYIDAVRVLNRIQTESKGIRPIKMNGSNDLAYYTYLRNVEYQVLAHFDWNRNRPELKDDHNENKHHQIALRCIRQGGRRDVFLGTRECQAYVEPCEFGEGKGFYDEYGELNFGLMFHGFDYPDEADETDEAGKHKLGVRLWDQKMTDGVIEFPKPRSKVVLRKTVAEYGDKYKFKLFKEGVNFKIELGE